MTGHPWTDEQITLLIRLWGDGMPVLEMAERLGVTVAAITGKVHRLGLTKRQASTRRRPDGQACLNQNPQVNGRRVAPRVTLEPLLSAPVPPPRPALGDRFRIPAGCVGACCWPTTDRRPWLFCEAPTVPGKPFCADHAKIGYETLEERAARRRMVADAELLAL
jgi:GcrA cell cycle regulator